MKIRKLIYGKVTIHESNSTSCKCNFQHPQFLINNVDYIESIWGSYSVSYYSSNDILEYKIGTPYGEYYEGTQEYDNINNCFREKYLTNFYGHTDNELLNTCYSEWTCGDPGYESIARVSELRNLDGKIVVFFLSK